MSKILEVFYYYLSIVLRYLPVRYSTGLITIGTPTEDSPVFVSGNYFNTVVRLKRALKGYSCYILVADSAGINVWCASGVGDFNEHKIADAVNTYNLIELVNHRRLILPQLAAVGVDRKRLKDECGFSSTWGPANLDDLPDYINNNYRCNSSMRHVRFTIKDKWYMAIGMLFAYFFSFVKYYVIFAIIFGFQYNDYAISATILLILSVISTVFVDHMPFKWPANNIVFMSSFSFLLIFCYVIIISPEKMSMLWFYLVANSIVVFFIAIDMLGSTVGYKTTILNWLKSGTNRSLYTPKILTSCKSCGSCVKTCPKNVLIIKDKKIIVDKDRDCCECLACIKQCDYNSIENANRGVYKHDIKSISQAYLDEVM